MAEQTSTSQKLNQLFSSENKELLKNLSSVFFPRAEVEKTEALFDLIKNESVKLSQRYESVFEKPISDMTPFHTFMTGLREGASVFDFPSSPPNLPDSVKPELETPSETETTDSESSTPNGSTQEEPVPAPDPSSPPLPESISELFQTLCGSKNVEMCLEFMRDVVELPNFSMYVIMAIGFFLMMFGIRRL